MTTKLDNVELYSTIKPVSVFGVTFGIAQRLATAARSRNLIAVALAIAFTPFADAATTMTGLIEMATDSSGNYNGGNRWNTIGGDSVVTIYVIGSSNFSGPFVNGPSDDASAAISIPLTPGTHTFTFLAAGGTFEPFQGLNIFFNGNNGNPGISAFAPTHTSATPPIPPIFSNGAAQSQALNGNTVPAANTFTFTDGDNVVTLTTYHWAEPSVYNVDRVRNIPFVSAVVGVDGVPDRVGQFTINVTPAAASPPVILTSPASQTVTVGETVTFNVTAAGASPLSYQWRYNGASIPAATQPSLVLSDVQLVQGGNYSVVVSNTLGSVISVEALLTVQPVPPVFVVRGPYLQSATPSNIVVRWRTDQATESRVRFGLVANSLTGNVADSNPTTEHLITLNNLTPGTKYFYAIAAGTNTLAGGGDYFFTTPPASPKPTRIWAIGDSGTASLGSSAPSIVRDAYYTFTGQRPTDVWLMLGDNAYFSGTDIEYQAAVFNVYQQLLRTTPVWPTIGNHETYAPDAFGNIAYYDIFSLPEDGRAGGIPSGTERYYSFDYGDIHFVCLDSELSDKSPGGPMLTWLEQDLAANTKEWLIAFWHSPPYSKGSHNSDFELNLVQMRERVGPVLENYGVDLVLCGHSHSYERSYLLNGHYGQSSSLVPAMVQDAGSGRSEETGVYLKSPTGAQQGAVYVVAGSAGQTSGGSLNHPAMFISLNRLGSMVIDVESNRLEAKFLRETGAVDDQFTIIKGTAAPSIVSGPASQTAPEGTTLSFNVVVNGTRPLSYQWRFNGASIAGATNSTLTLNNVQMSQAGNYSVVVANAVGSVTSLDALLTVTPPPPCTSPPAGLVAWWTGDGDANDIVGGNHGSLRNGANFGPGMVGQGFSLDGVDDFVLVPDSPSLSLTNELSFELWFKMTGHSSGGSGVFDKRNPAGPVNYGFYVSASEVQLYYDDPTVQGGDQPGNIIEFARHVPVPSLNEFHHFAGTYRQADANHIDLKMYIDGQLVETRTFSGNLTRTLNNWPVSIGFVGANCCPFKGIIDEVSLYNRALLASEIDAIFNAGVGGKCRGALPPVITSQPRDLVVMAGDTANFTVAAAGTSPLTYQWRFNGTAIAEQTNATLLLPNVQPNQAGNYSVVVSNALSSVTSTEALLTVNAALSEFDLSRDFSLASNPNGVWSYGAKETLGGALSLLSYSRGASAVGDEAWEFTAGTYPAVYHNGTSNTIGGGVGVYPPGTIWYLAGDAGTLRNFGVIRFTLPTGQSGTWRLETAVRPYLDGPPQGDTDFHVLKNDMELFGQFLSPMMGAGYTNTLTLAAGETVDFAIGRGEDNHLSGSGLKIQATLTLVSTSPAPPLILIQPVSQTVTVGDQVTFSVTAAGTSPLAYQWRFNGADIADATASSVTLSNVQLAQAGNYSVLVSNALGSVTSAEAMLTVHLPPATVRVVNVNAASGAEVSVPVELSAQGNENAMGFSLNFDSSVLAFNTALLGKNVPAGATLLVNTDQTSSGKLGLAVALAANATFNPGTQEVVVVKLTVAPVLSALTVPITFGDQPTLRQLSDPQAAVLPASFVPGSVAVVDVEFEGDVAPRPGGNKNLSITDWVQMGRFAAGLDSISSSSEFQRADCAPRASNGNGAITISDWVQAGRYAVGLDSLTPAGGPTSGGGGAGGGVALAAQAVSSRSLCFLNANIPQGQTNVVPVSLESQGDENALGFSVIFDTAKLKFVGAVTGVDASSAALNVNTDQAAIGKLGLALALPPGSTMPSGVREVVRLHFAALASAPASAPLSFGDQPVMREIADALAHPLNASYTTGTVTVVPPPGPPLSFTVSGRTLYLSWPTTPAGFELEATSGLPGSSWSTVSNVVVLGGQKFAPISIGPGQEYFRLKKP